MGGGVVEVPTESSVVNDVNTVSPSYKSFLLRLKWENLADIHPSAVGPFLAMGRRGYLHLELQLWA